MSKTNETVADTVTVVDEATFDKAVADAQAKCVAVREPRLIDAANDITSFASTDSARYVLNGVHCTQDYTEACDGMLLIRVPYATIPAGDFPPVKAAGPELKDCIIPSKAIVESIKNAGRNSTLPVLNMVHVSTNGDDRATLATTDLDNERTLRPKLIEGKYPDTEQVIPVWAPTLTISLGAELLATIAAYAKKHGKDGDAKGGSAINLEFKDTLSPCRFSITLEDGRKATGVLMPMRPS